MNKYHTAFIVSIQIKQNKQIKQKTEIFKTANLFILMLTIDKFVARPFC